MDRRRFIQIVATGATAVAAPSLLLGQAADQATLHIGQIPAASPVPESFTGLSYELAQLTEPEFFSGNHSQLIAFFKRLSPRGLLRVGGNTSEFCWFQIDPGTPAPKLHTPPGDLAQNWMPHRLFAIQAVALDHLADFLKATGWRTIFGLNFGNSTPERAADEAALVADKLGDHVAFFQIGNEPDFYRDANNGTRPPGWGFADYVREWIAFADAISARVSSARFGGPDTGASSDWVTRFGEEVAPRLGKRLVALSGHYYAEGPPNDPRVTIARLLAGNPQVTTSTRAIMAVAQEHQLSYHMTEGNSCYRGGKPHMSNALASALWGADYALLLATLGCAGINLHGGDSRFLSAGLGDHNPGLLAAGVGRQAVTNGFYTTIETEQGKPVAARPLFYGLMLAQQFAGATLLPVAFRTAENVTAYAAQKDGKQLAAIIHKGSAKPVTVVVSTAKPFHEAKGWRLQGPALDATTGTTLGGAALGEDASWTPRAEPFRVEKGEVEVTVPPGSGLLLFLT